MPVLKNGKLKLVLKEVGKGGKPKTHDVTYLLAHLPPDKAMALAKKMEDYISPSDSPLGAIAQPSSVLAFWPATFPMFPADATSLFQALKELRAIWYRRADPRQPNHISLGTANRTWQAFIRFMEYMSRSGLPAINYGSIGANSDWYTDGLRKAARTVTDLARVNVIRGRAGDADYTDALIVPLSIHLSDEAYLAKYEHDLQEAMDAIYKAAVADLDAFIRMEQAGQKLIENVRPKYAKAVERFKSAFKLYDDPEHNQISLFDPKRPNLVSIFDPNHPDFFAYKLAMVDVEMGGIPKSCRERDLERSVSGRGPSGYIYNLIGPARWKRLGVGITSQNRYELFGHLGVMSIEAMVACLAIIHIENPSINVMSLQRAVLEDADGHSILLIGAGEVDAHRLTVDKPRAGAQKSTILKGKSLEAMKCILRWTAKCRKVLKDVGDPNANKLLLYVNQNNRVTFASNDDINHAFGLQEARTIKCLSFVQRHPELSDWASRVSLSALRISAGVLAWFKSGGDEEATRRAFGHATSATSLCNYIPLPIQEAMYIRMIRRFQNLLICAACTGEDYLLQATDFLTLAELHEFLSQMLTSNGMAAGNDLLDAIRGAFGFRDAPPAATASVQVVPVSLEDHEAVYLTLTVDGLAMLRLYRDRLLAADISAVVLDTPDPRTGTKPRLWLDLGNAFEQHDASIIARYPEYRAVFEQAARRVEELRGKVHFPDLTTA